jgi:hypothetical protein
MMKNSSLDLKTILLDREWEQLNLPGNKKKLDTTCIPAIPVHSLEGSLQDCKFHLWLSIRFLQYWARMMFHLGRRLL